MPHEYSAIDDVLMSSKPASMPETPEVVDIKNEQVRNTLKDANEPTPQNPYDISGTIETSETDISKQISEPKEPENESLESDNEEKSSNLDEYGNKIEPLKTYTEEEVNERINKAIRERLERMARNNPAQQAAIETAKQNFSPDSNSEEPWQVQLEQFIDQTIEKRTQKQIQEQQRLQEQAATAEFETKFTQGMEKFQDFREVVGSQPFDDVMTMSLRGVDNPAAFAYAASKLYPKDLERISKITDPYRKVAEMGKLEERMRKVKPTTAAPKPVSHTKGDTSIKMEREKPREPTIEDLMHDSERKRKAQIMQRQRR